MKPFRISRILFMLLATGFPPVLFAADYPDGNIPPKNSLPADLFGQTAIPQLRTDPFQISYFMQQKAQAHNQGGAQFTPLQNAQAPTLAMKGIVNEGLALLEVQGSGVYLVRKGDTLSLNRQGQNIVIKIEKIDRLSLMVKMGTLAEIIVVR